MGILNLINRMFTRREEQVSRSGIPDFDITFNWLKQKLDQPLDKSWTVLEVGYGKKGWARLYKQHFDEIYGIDLEDYSAYHPGVKTLKGDVVESIALGANSVDLVVSHSVFEHISDVAAALKNINRVIKVRGYIFITISPLYYSASGSHINQPNKLNNWEHLDQTSEHYLIDNPLKGAKTSGHSLNKITYSQFLAHVGQLPWSIVNCLLSFDGRPIPSYVQRSQVSELDLRLYGFMFLARKDFDLN